MSQASQHGGLSEERWSSFNLDQQILMIGNEMNRGRKLLTEADRTRLQSCYERVLRLADLTVSVNPRRSLRRELLRWRDLVAELYVAPRPEPARHDQAFRCLLRFTPEASRQIPLLLDSPDPSANP